MKSGNQEAAKKPSVKEGPSEEKKAAKGRGGARPGAGRKSGSGAFGEATQPIRVPRALVPSVEQALADYKQRVARAREAGAEVSPVDALAMREGAASVAEGAPSGKPLNLGALLASSPESSFAWTASRDIPALGIIVGDLLVIDRSAKASKGSIVAMWGEDGIELSRALSAGQEAWGVAVGLARRL